MSIFGSNNDEVRVNGVTRKKDFRDELTPLEKERMAQIVAEEERKRQEKEAKKAEEEASLAAYRAELEEKERKKEEENRKYLEKLRAEKEARAKKFEPFVNPEARAAKRAEATKKVKNLLDECRAYRAFLTESGDENGVFACDEFLKYSAEDMIQNERKGPSIVCMYNIWGKLGELERMYHDLVVSVWEAQTGIPCDIYFVGDRKIPAEFGGGYYNSDDVDPEFEKWNKDQECPVEKPWFFRFDGKVLCGASDFSSSSHLFRFVQDVLHTRLEIDDDFGDEQEDANEYREKRFNYWDWSHKGVGSKIPHKWGYLDYRHDLTKDLYRAGLNNELEPSDYELLRENDPSKVHGKNHERVKKELERKRAIAEVCRCSRMRAARTNEGEARVNAVIAYWLSLHPDWRLIVKNCAGPYSNHCLYIADGNDSITSHYSELDHLLVGPGGVIHIETKNYVGRLVIDGGEHWKKLPLVVDYKEKDFMSEWIRSPEGQVRSHEQSLRAILSEAEPDPCRRKVHSCICIASPGSIILSSPEEVAKNCKYDVITFETLPEYLDMVSGIMTASCQGNFANPDLLEAAINGRKAWETTKKK